MSKCDAKTLGRMQEEALDWIVVLKAGWPTWSDIDDCRAWRARSPDHEESFRRAALLWRQLRVAARELRDEEKRRAVGAPVA
ncbi:DUF4880 domain-containing protein [Methyloferula stellata]|uniref:FecR/PupR family sigma factor regulator n=1 Tax=Methyloferula stellata TaxID=876270 RepID=UPI0009FBAB99